MKTKASLCATFWMCCAIPVYIIAQPAATLPYRFEHFDTHDGLASDFAYAIQQDSLGFLWVIHDVGLSRYDGYNFRVYRNDPSDSTKLDHTISDGRSAGLIDGLLLPDRSKNIWVTSQLGIANRKLVLNYYERKRDQFIKYYPDLKGARVFCADFEKDNSKIWLGTIEPGNGVFSFELTTKETKQFINNCPNTSNLDSGLECDQKNSIADLLDQDSLLLLGTWDGLWKFNKITRAFHRPACSDADTALLYHTPVVIILPEDKSDLLWLIALLPTTGELIQVDKNFSILHRFRYPEGMMGTGIVRDRDGIFWTASKSNGLYRYDPKDSSLVIIKNIPGDNHSLRSNSLRGLTVDRNGNLWLTTNDRGISKLKKESVKIYNYPFTGELTGQVTYTERGQNFLVASRSETSLVGDNELLVAPISPGRLDDLKFRKIELNEPLPGLVNHLSKGRGKLWLSTWDHGVASLPLNSKTGVVEAGPLKLFQHDPENPNTIAGGWAATDILEDATGILWVGSYDSGLSKVNLRKVYGQKGAVERYRHIPGDSTSISNDRIGMQFYADGENGLWIVTASGIDLMRNGVFEHPFNDDFSMTVRRSSMGTHLIGTNQGLFESATGEKFSFQKIQAPLTTKYGAYGMEYDRLGRLWITNPEGLILYDQKNQNEILFGEKDGIDFTRSWIGQTSDGVFVTADPKGITLVDPLSFSIDSLRPTPAIISLQVNNKIPIISNVNSGSDDFYVTSDISLLEELILDYEHNNFTLEFSSMELTAPEKNLYRHKLEGFDPDWIETDWKSRTATYTNLDAGKYVFKVKASNSHGIWNDNEVVLAVVILPPPWQTWWAYTLYGLAIFGVVLYWRNYEIKRLRLKQRAEHLAELDNVKTRFFSNISHEFRTPITLILGPLKELYNGKSKEDIREVLGPVIRNSHRLLALINQLLDISKLEAGKMQLRASVVELVGFLRELASSYESLASDKKIDYSFTTEVAELHAYVDAEKLEKVIHNVLANAFKFTKEGGEVSMHLKVLNKQAVISVKDTGIGIKAAEIAKVFDRFYQVDNTQTRSYEGSGLGMALARELMELHHGKISVESKEGEGTTFTVMIPLGSAHLKREEIVDSERQRKSEALLNGAVYSENDGEVSMETEAGPSVVQHPMLLVVEDNADMRNYIRKTLHEQYQIVEATNGKEGLAKAQQAVPDLIISDIMMPEMDGYKLCERIKTDELTSHIPVILLTAKADRESKLTGLETGADDYLSKPFDADELKLIIRNRLEARRTLREHFGKSIRLEPKQISITSLDEKFLTKVLDIIELHMDDENFSIGELSQEAGYSHIHFYRKIKGLSGQTPNQFLRTIRLKRAAELLRHKSDNVSQIAYSVGFSSQSYFIKCFKEQFGVTPGQFVESVSGTESIS